MNSTFFILSFISLGIPYHLSETLIVFIVTRNITTQYIDLDFAILAVFSLRTRFRSRSEGKRLWDNLAKVPLLRFEMLETSSKLSSMWFPS